eukprot:TRINITY_DN15621_c0_g1_i4.p1 TRINITY_DN15621_c0_g1~~TRINITY_DN15621_c0_g1_i4.p1  ORF type:complete len:369 (+),score=78.98 TRINITY_DN15621_c0_g1_i4:543-1649(+)
MLADPRDGGPDVEAHADKHEAEEAQMKVPEPAAEPVVQSDLHTLAEKERSDGHNREEKTSKVFDPATDCKVPEDRKTDVQPQRERRVIEPILPIPGEDPWEIYVRMLSLVFNIFSTHEEIGPRINTDVDEADLPVNAEGHHLQRQAYNMTTFLDDTTSENKEVLLAALGAARSWVAHSFQRLHNPTIAQTVLRQWLGHYDEEFQLKILRLHASVMKVLSKAVIVEDTDSKIKADNKTTICENTFSPYAFVKPMDGQCPDSGCGEFSDNRYVIRLCARAFQFTRGSRTTNWYESDWKQLAGFITHEAFHHASNPQILDQQDCNGYNCASYCARARKEKAQNNGYNYQYVVAAAASTWEQKSAPQQHQPP